MNNSKCFVALVSSIHQIELTALVMLRAAGLLQPEDEILVLVDYDAEIPTSPVKQIKSPRLAFPTPIMLLEGRDTYRQLFAPTIPNDAQSNLSSLRLSLNAWLTVLEGSIEEVVLNKIRTRAEQLVDAVRKSALLPGTLTSAVIHYVLTDFLCTHVKVESYSEFVNSERGQTASYDALVSIAKEILAEMGPASFTFRKGGYVSCAVQGRQERLRFHRGSVTESSVSLSNENETLTLNLSGNPRELLLLERYSNIEPSSISRIVCRGPLVMAFLSRLGIPVDVPWYHESVRTDSAWDPTAACVGLELISPVSVAAQERTSQRAGGSGMRLGPNGYSLLDFQHPITNRLAASIACLNDGDDPSFDDWQDLLANYPWRRQKALKDQGGVSEYCQRRLYAMRQSLKSGSSNLIDGIGNSMTRLSPTQYGKFGLQLLTLLRYSRDVRFSDQVIWSSEQWAALRLVGLIRDESFDDPLVFSLISDLLKASRYWQDSVSRVMNSDTIGDTGNEILTLLLDQAPKSDPGTPVHELPSIQTQRQVWLELQSETFMYYRAVLAISASLLKTHALSAWLLFGVDEFLGACGELLRGRHGEPYLWLRARLWKTSSR